MGRRRRRGARPPHMLLMPDKRGWAFDFHCSYEAEALERRGWHVDTVYLVEGTPPPLPVRAYDLAFNPNCTRSSLDRRFRGRLVRGIYSHRWALSSNPRRALDRALRGTVAVVVPNRKLQAMVGWYYPQTFRVSEGVDPQIMRFTAQRTASDLVAGWSGNPSHPIKRLDEIVRPACVLSGVDLRIAAALTREQLCAFYNDVDVVLVASRDEGSPNAVFEAGACGRAVIGTAVGIIPEAIVDGKNGFIVDGTLEAFVQKLNWCKAHLDQVRAIGLAHREVVLRDYTVQRESEQFADLMETLLREIEHERRLSSKYQRLASALGLKAASLWRRIAGIRSKP